MKNYIFSTTLLIAICISPALAQAQTATLSSSQINAIIQLLRSFGADQSVINNVQIALNGGTTATGGSGFCYNFSTDLTVGNNGSDVSALNQALASSGIDTANKTSTFTEDTAGGVVSFQAKYGIRKTGYVGQLTRAKLNALYGCTVQTPTTSNDWVVVFTDRGTGIPQDIRSFICGTALPTAVTWFDREAATYGKTKPFFAAQCIDQQVTLSGDSLNGEAIFAEGSNFNMPINANAVINLLEQDSRIKSAKYVTVIHYMENDLPFVNFEYGSKYDFGFIRKGASSFYYPVLTVDNYSEEFIHEFMHKLGATDKYDGPTAACLTNPKTGNEYSGYDIMCHRIEQAGGYTAPVFSEVKVTEPTATEIGWE